MHCTMASCLYMDDNHLCEDNSIEMVGELTILSESLDLQTQTPNNCLSKQDLLKLTERKLRWHPKVAIEGKMMVDCRYVNLEFWTSWGEIGGKNSKLKSECEFDLWIDLVFASDFETEIKLGIVLIVYLIEIGHQLQLKVDSPCFDVSLKH